MHTLNLTSSTLVNCFSNPPCLRNYQTLKCITLGTWDFNAKAQPVKHHFSNKQTVSAQSYNDSSMSPETHDEDETLPKKPLHIQEDIIRSQDFQVIYALEVPWYANLPRVETRFYIENYDFTNGVSNSRTSNRMADALNSMMFEFSKKDYNKGQVQHNMEWRDIQEWHRKCNLVDCGISQKHLLHSYFVAAASIFEPERAKERLAWAKSLIFFEMISAYFAATSLEQKEMFGNDFRSSFNSKEKTTCRSKRHGLLCNLIEFLHDLSMDAIKETGRDIRPQLQDVWETWLTRNTRTIQCGEEAELLVHTINLCAGFMASDGRESQTEYNRLCSLINKIRCMLQEIKSLKIRNNDSGIVGLKALEIDAKMQALVQLVLERSSKMKKTFLVVAKAFYYTAYFTDETIDFHVSKVLFEPIV